MTLPKRNALGKGLGALLTSPDTDITTKNKAGNEPGMADSISRIPVSAIEANPFQPRTHFEEDALRELSESIKALGLIQPVTVRKLGYDKYQLISGERRFRASQLAGLTDIPAYIRIANDQAMLEMALVENIQREELDAVEIGLAYQRMIEELSLTQEEIADKVAKKRSTVANYLRLLKLPPEIQLGIRSRQISMGHARALVNIEDPALQKQLFNEIISQELSVRQVEDAARQSKKPTFEKPETAGVMSESFKLAQRSLQSKLSLPVDIKSGKNGKGSVAIKFSNEAEFKELLRKLLS